MNGVGECVCALRGVSRISVIPNAKSAETGEFPLRVCICFMMIVFRFFFGAFTDEKKKRLN